MNETRKLEAPADEPSNEWTSDVEDHQDDEKTESRRMILDTYQLTRTPSSSDCRDSKEASSNLSYLNLGKFVLKKKTRFFSIYQDL